MLGGLCWGLGCRPSRTLVRENAIDQRQLRILGESQEPGHSLDAAPRREGFFGGEGAQGGRGILLLGSNT